MIEETDILQITTGFPSQKQKEIQQKQNEKDLEKNINLKQQV